MWTVADLQKTKDLTIEELAEIIEHLRENHQVELKAATQLPKSFWESCSSFANTEDGNIILGVREGTGGKDNEILGVDNVSKTLTDMWNILSNPTKISLRVLDNSDIAVKDISGKSIILISVREAETHQKPVYLNGKLENTYLRTGDGDRKATNDEIAALLRNTALNADSQVLSNYTLDDLDPASLLRFKTLAASRYPNQNFLQMSDEDFLIRTGAAMRDRSTGEFRLYSAAVLFIGKTNIITELFPHFHLDYYEYKNNSQNRWDYRISDNDYLNKEINLLSFFESVQARLPLLVSEPFALDENLRRKPDTGLTEISFREALVNALIHSDYQMSDSSVRIEARPHQFVFSNPGQMLISSENFFTGGNSKLRNERLMKLFSLIGLAERQGFGGAAILENAISRSYKLPEIQTSLTRTTLKIWTEELVNLDQSLSEEEKTILFLTGKQPDHQKYSFSDLQDLTQLSEYKLRKSLSSLTKKNYVIKSGRGRGMTYTFRQ